MQTPLKALLALNHIITQEVFRTEQNLQGTTGADKKSIVKNSVSKILDIIYDAADNTFNCPDMVDDVSKQMLIPIISELVDVAVNNFNLFGWKQDNGI